MEEWRTKDRWSSIDRLENSPYKWKESTHWQRTTHWIKGATRFRFLNEEIYLPEIDWNRTWELNKEKEHTFEFLKGITRKGRTDTIDREASVQENLEACLGARSITTHRNLRDQFIGNQWICCNRLGFLKVFRCVVLIFYNWCGC